MTYELSIAEAAEIDLYKAFFGIKKKKMSLELSLNTRQRIRLNQSRKTHYIHKLDIVKFVSCLWIIFLMDSLQSQRKSIVITAVFHTSLSPDRWHDR